MIDSDFEFVHGSDAILEVLTTSLEQGQAVGINSPALGTGLYITAVEKILNYNDFFDQREVVVVLKGYDITGYFFEKNVVRLHEIKSVWPLTSKFRNPFLSDASRKVR